MKKLFLGFLVLTSFSVFAKVSDFGTLTLQNAKGDETYYSTITNIQVTDEYLEIFTANKKHKYASCKIAFVEVSDNQPTVSVKLQRILDTINANIGKNPIHIQCISRTINVSGKLKSITMPDSIAHGNWVNVVVGKAVNWSYE